MAVLHSSDHYEAPRCASGSSHRGDAVEHARVERAAQELNHGLVFDSDAGDILPESRPKVERRVQQEVQLSQGLRCQSMIVTNPLLIQLKIISYRSKTQK